MGEFPLNLLNLGIGYRSSDETLQGPNSVAKVGSLESLCAFSKSAPLGPEADEGSGTQILVSDTSIYSTADMGGRTEWHGSKPR